MDAVLRRLDDLISQRRLPWDRADNTVTVDLWKSGRQQRVHIDRGGELYVFWSTVVGCGFVTKSDDAWRGLAYRAWRKNALKDLVTFAFDEEDRLIGLIEQPVATLNHEELQLYIEILAKECDRFEYVLTGTDEA